MTTTFDISISFTLVHIRRVRTVHWIDNGVLKHRCLGTAYLHGHGEGRIWEGLF